MTIGTTTQGRRRFLGLVAGSAISATLIRGAAAQSGNTVYDLDGVRLEVPAPITFKRSERAAGTSGDIRMLVEFIADGATAHSNMMVRWIRASPDDDSARAALERMRAEDRERYAQTPDFPGSEQMHGALGPWWLGELDGVDSFFSAGLHRIRPAPDASIVFMGRGGLWLDDRLVEIIVMSLDFGLSDELIAIGWEASRRWFEALRTANGVV